MKTLFRLLALLPLIVLCPLAHAVDDFVATGSLNNARFYHTATLLANGKVLIAGGDVVNNGNSLTSAELYDPATGLWSVTGSMANRRTEHTVTLLADGKVLVVGGYNISTGSLTSSELYDPTTGLWSTTGSMATARRNHTATLLANGKVLVAAGYGNNGLLTSAELYDPATGLWITVGSMVNGRFLHTATLLANGKVLVAGGYGGSGYFTSVELYDPATGLWSSTGSLANARGGYTATLLANGKLLVTGGSYNGYLSSAELYDPATGLWSTTGSLANLRDTHTATLLANGKVLVVGGRSGDSSLTSAELYDPVTGLWNTTSVLASARYSHTATLLANGKLLVAGGYANGSLTSAELYNTTPPAWSLFTAAESALAVADVGLVNLSPIENLSVVSGAASHGGSGNALKFQTVDDGSSFAERTIVGPAVVNFWWRVSSEEGADFFSYSLDGTVQQSISGNGSWVNRSLTLGAGTHTLRWTYAKDVDSANFEDAGYLDDLVIQEAYTNLEVSTAGTAITGSSTLDFGTVQQDAAVVTQSLTLKNTGTISQSVAASLPANGAFVFGSGLRTASLTLSAGQQSTLVLKMPTNVAGQLSALLSITATGSRTAAPAITLSGNVQAKAPNIECSWSGGAIASGQSTAIDFGATPSDVTFTVGNTGTGVMTISSVNISPAGNFEVISQPSSTVAIGGTTSFTLRALDANRGSHTATVTIASDDADTSNFTFPLTSKSYLAVVGTGFTHGSFLNNGTTTGWDSASTTLANGSSGQALKTGSTPDGGNSTIGATFDGPGLLSWNWQVSAQANYDWLVCEVNGVEVAGISVKTAAWQSQVVQIPAGASVRWIYRKDAAFSAGKDTGYLSDIRFSKFNAAQTSFQEWSAAHGDLSPMQPIPAGGMQAMFAWLGGVDPATGPSAGQFQPSVSSGFYKYRYTVAKAAAGIVQPQISTDLVTWNSRKMKQTLISEDETSAVMELSVPATGKVFSRMATEIPAQEMVKLQGGNLPSSSPLGAQSVATFYIAQTETTWSRWQMVRTWAVAHGYDLSGVGAGNGDSFPVTNVSWYQSVKWCNARSEIEGLTPVYTVNGSVYRTGDSVPALNASANGYRLPGEAEWEFAARGGVSTHGYDYSGSNDPNAVAWYSNNSGGTTHSVATKQANELGLSDMSGNVWEWCFDWFQGYDYVRVARGGGWSGDFTRCLVTDLGASHPSFPENYVGFRVARSLVP